ncbi:Actin/actin-like protein [Marasmius fiardii PR-910]|nr:Actin/actin-like protein [Marasmius fiardii PR-910]
MVTYGGDEVSALVLDIGTSSVRAGYAGDDSPKAIIPTQYGFMPPSNDQDVDMGDNSDSTEKPKGARSFIGEAGPSLFRPGMQIGNPMNDTLIQDFGPIPALVRHVLEDSMRVNPSEHPILVTEPAWNTPENRERMAEIMFEEFQAPAFYIANTGVLNTFAAGKGSGLVVDVGQSVASVIPVVDGFVLRKGVAYSNLPKLVAAHARHVLLGNTIDLIPHQLIASKTPVEPNMPPQYTIREDKMAGVTDSWRQWYEDRAVEEWMQSVGGILEQGWNDQAAVQRPPRQYEFPTGFNTFFGPDRYHVGELFFYHKPNLVASNSSLPRHIPALISDSLRACDIELRQVLIGNVIVTGGGSLFSGFTDRLHNELARSFPHVKIHAPGNPVERRYGAWLGGSILASLGTFHQLWISKEEWMEHGKGIVAQRCK